MRTRTPMRVLLVAALTLALLPMLSTFAPGGQVAGFTTASPAMADQIWYQSVGRASATAACEKSTTTELAAGWTNWAPSWAKWVNGGNGGFVCNRQITWAFDTPPVSCATGGICRLGDIGPGGGLVFLISGGRTYEMAPKNWNSVAGDPNQVWTTTAPKCYAAGLTIADQNCQSDNLYPETTAGAQTASTTAAVAIGMGGANTDAIIARMNAGSVTTTDYAAGLARGYTNNGFTDWFLPSRDELNAMCNYSRNPAAPAAPTVRCAGTQDGAFDGGAFGFAAANSYWSSSQFVVFFAWFQDFDDGNQSNDVKNVSNRVRPVRAF